VFVIRIPWAFGGGVPRKNGGGNASLGRGGGGKRKGLFVFLVLGGGGGEKRGEKKNYVNFFHIGFGKGNLPQKKKKRKGESYFGKKETRTPSSYLCYKGVFSSLRQRGKKKKKGEGGAFFRGKFFGPP